MEFMLDTLNLDEIKKWARVLPLAGVTSNPTIAKKEGDIDFFDRIHKVREIIGGSPSIHVQVVAKDYEGILKDAAKIREQCDENTYIKVPTGTSVTNSATAIYTVFQGLLAIEAGADYLAPYYNRMENLNIDSAQVISQLASAIERNHSSSKILAASFKNVAQINRAFKEGTQAITAGADVFEAAFGMPSIAKAVDDFEADWSAVHQKNTI